MLANTFCEIRCNACTMTLHTHHLTTDASPHNPPNPLAPPSQPPRTPHPTSSHTPPTDTGKGCVDGLAALTQIPHMSPDLLRKLSRKKVKVLSDLTSMKNVDRLVTLTECGLTNHEVDDVEVALSAMPSVSVTSVSMVVEGLQVGVVVVVGRVYPIHAPCIHIHTHHTPLHTHTPHTHIHTQHYTHTHHIHTYTTHTHIHHTGW